MSLEQGQQDFRDLVNQTSPEALPVFLKWVRETADEMLNDVDYSNEDVMMKSIQEDLRQSLPLNAVLPSENLMVPVIGQNADCQPATTVHVDGFLYEDDAVDDLCEERKMSRNYCCECGSHQVAPLTFISHSSSLTQCKYMFQYLLPELGGKVVLDVGSRLGAVLYAAYYYSSASHILGVEINLELCHLQQKVIDKYQLQDRIQVTNADICTQDEALAAANVVILNNVFEFFIPADVQQRVWCCLRDKVRKAGTLLLVSPSLEESLRPLQTGIDVASWVKPLDTKEMLAKANLHLFGNAHHEASDLTDIHVYQVL